MAHQDPPLKATVKVAAGLRPHRRPPRAHVSDGSLPRACRRAAPPRRQFKTWLFASSRTTEERKSLSLGSGGWAGTGPVPGGQAPL